MTVDEYATLIYYWHGDPHPEKIDEVFAFLAGWAALDPSPGRQMAIAGVVLALETRHPDNKPVWRQSFPDLYREIDRAVSHSTGRAEWADFHIAQWFITHDLKCVDEILDCIADGGETSQYARHALSTAAEKCVPFRYALKKAQKSRASRMIINAIQ
jgi:hypothetical protein